MTTRPFLFLGIAAIASLAYTMSGCSESEMAPINNGNGGSSGSGQGGSAATGSGGSTTTGAGGSTTTGAGGSTTTGAGGSTTTGAGGSTTTGAGGAIGGSCQPDPAPEASCTTANAKTGAVCTKDCCIVCGFNGVGNKICTCGAGAYTACPCAPPSNWGGAPTAPYCATADGTTLALKNTACTTEWAECIGKDIVSGTTPQGCVCMNNPLTASLQWFCGSTNKWFALAP